VLRKREALSGGPSSQAETFVTKGAQASATDRRNEGDEGKVRACAAYDWRGNDRKRSRDKQRTSHRDRTVFMLAMRAEEPTGGSQSVRSSNEAGNDRGVKGRRKVEA